MKDPTVESYKKIGTKYPEGKIDPAEAAWICKALATLRPGTTVFEFGSGLGRRSSFIESKGYRVQRSDVAGPFLEHLGNSSPPPLPLDLRRDAIPRSAAFYASAVLLHFPKKEIPEIIQKIYRATEPGGVFFFSLKEGSGEGQEEGPWGSRYFAYWQEPEILAVLLEAGWEKVAISRDSGWIQVIARRS